MPICLDCLQDKEPRDFYTHKVTGLSDICKACQLRANALRRSNLEAYGLLKATRKLRRKARQLESAPKEKRCSSCGVCKSLELFRTRLKGLYGRNSDCLDCERSKNRAYYWGNRESIKHKKRELWSSKGLTPDQKEKARSRAKKWHLDNKERHNATCRAYAKKHRKEAVERTRAWEKSHPNEVRNHQSARRAKKKGSGGIVSKGEWLQVLEYFNHSCAYCLKPFSDLTIDHLIPIVKGGPHILENVVPACRSCNSSKKDRPIWAMVNN